MFSEPSFRRATDTFFLCEADLEMCHAAAVQWLSVLNDITNEILTAAYNATLSTKASRC